MILRRCRKLEAKNERVHPKSASDAPLCFPAVWGFGCVSGLLTQAESLHDGTITLDVLALEIVEERTALTYHLHE